MYFLQDKITYKYFLQVFWKVIFRIDIKIHFFSFRPSYNRKLNSFWKNLFLQEILYVCKKIFVLKESSFFLLDFISRYCQWQIDAYVIGTFVFCVYPLSCEWLYLHTIACIVFRTLRLLITYIVVLITICTPLDLQ